MNKRNLLLLLLLIAAGHLTYGQDNKTVDKKIDKANKLDKEDKYKDAEKILLKLTKSYPSSGKAWDALAMTEHDIYLNEKQYDKVSKGLFGGNMSITVTDSTGKDITDKDTLGAKLIAMLKEMTPSKIALDKMIDNCKLACLHTNDAYNSSALIRIYLVDEKVDTGVKDMAIKYFNKAEEEFDDHNYQSAAKYYQKAIDEDSTFYKARLYLGDAFYFSKDYHGALNYYTQCAHFKPKMLEPLKYIADAYSQLEEYDKAEETSIKAIMLYPDMQMFVKWGNSLSDQHKDYSSAFVPRDVSINMIGTEPDPAPKNSPWAYYCDALKLAEPYCNKDGIFIKTNSLTKSKYLEVFAWEYMLSKTSDPKFDLAKKMQKQGQLEAFVLVGNFQYDFYAQFKDFVTDNPEKVTQFFKQMEQ